MALLWLVPDVLLQPPQQSCVAALVEDWFLLCNSGHTLWVTRWNILWSLICYLCTYISALSTLIPHLQVIESKVACTTNENFIKTSYFKLSWGVVSDDVYLNLLGHPFPVQQNVSEGMMGQYLSDGDLGQSLQHIWDTGERWITHRHILDTIVTHCTYFGTHQVFGHHLKM